MVSPRRDSFICTITAWLGKVVICLYNSLAIPIHLETAKIYCRLNNPLQILEKLKYLMIQHQTASIAEGLQITNSY